MVSALPSLSLNHAVLPAGVVATPFTVRSRGLVVLLEHHAATA